MRRDGYFKLRVHKPIKLDNIYDSMLNIDKGLGIRAKEDIYANEEIFLVSTDKCITGLELVDCDRVKAHKINTSVSKIAAKYYPNNISQ